MKEQPPLLEARSLTVGYGSRSGKSLPVAGPLDVDIHAGQLICLLGPNGSGKSTLLRTLVGLQPALGGSVLIAGMGHGHPNPAQLAKKISLVLTDSVRNTHLTVYSLIALGRYPYSNWLGLLGDTDKALIRSAIEATGVGGLMDRKMASLSDGECQKVMLARALAQDTPLMMLDEPTAHLDLPSRIQLMQLLHRLAKETQKGILISTHELDLALQVADEVWLLQTGGQFHTGAPEDLVLNGTFQVAFDKEGIHFDKTTGAFRIHREEGKHIVLLDEAGSPALLWTQKALQRKGFTVVAGPNATGLVVAAPVTAGHSGPCTVRITEEGGRTIWLLERNDRLQQHETIAALLEALKTYNENLY
jgi:iron complex transport system ATP-binding protein